MLSSLFRKSIFVIALLPFFSSISFAAENERAQKFSEAQQLATQGQLSEAITIYQSLIRSFPRFPEAYNNLAALYLKQKNTKKAKAMLEQGLQAHKGYGALYESLTTINVAMAREAYSKALQIDLKPSTISIASVSLEDKKQSHNKNTSTETKVNKEIATEPQKSEEAVSEEQVVNEVVEQAKQEARVQTPVIQTQVTTSVKQVKNSESIETVLNAWSAAWSAQAVDIYLSFYHKQYKPSNGLSHKSWLQSRRYRLKKPSWIKIVLSDLNIEKNTGKQAIVSFKQSYQSNGFHDMSSKQMVLFYTNDGWRIFREKSL